MAYMSTGVSYVFLSLMPELGKKMSCRQHKKYVSGVGIEFK